MRTRFSPARCCCGGPPHESNCENDPEYEPAPGFTCCNFIEVPREYLLTDGLGSTTLIWSEEEGGWTGYTRGQRQHVNDWLNDGDNRRAVDCVRTVRQGWVRQYYKLTCVGGGWKPLPDSCCVTLDSHAGPCEIEGRTDPPYKVDCYFDNVTNKEVCIRCWKNWEFAPRVEFPFQLEVSWDYSFGVQNPDEWSGCEPRRCIAFYNPHPDDLPEGESQSGWAPLVGRAKTLDINLDTGVAPIVLEPPQCGETVDGWPRACMWTFGDPDAVCDYVPPPGEGNFDIMAPPPGGLFAIITSPFADPEGPDDDD